MFINFARLNFPVWDVWNRLLRRNNITGPFGWNSKTKINSQGISLNPINQCLRFEILWFLMPLSPWRLHFVRCIFCLFNPFRCNCNTSQWVSEECGFCCWTVNSAALASTSSHSHKHPSRHLIYALLSRIYLLSRFLAFLGCTFGQHLMGRKDWVTIKDKDKELL